MFDYCPPEPRFHAFARVTVTNAGKVYLRDKWRQQTTPALLDKNLTCEFNRRNSSTPSKSCMKTEQLKPVFTNSWVEELDRKAKENSLTCGF